MIIKKLSDLFNIFGKSKTKNKPESGDIIGVNRFSYEHYGVYENEFSVYHYSGDESDFSQNLKIKNTSLKKFLSGSKQYFILNFPSYHDKPGKIIVNKLNQFKSHIDFSDLKNLFDFLKWHKYKLFSPEETVARAKSRLGEDKYNMLFNNCEHYAIWCKTGISESHQVKRLLKILRPPIIHEDLF